MSRKHISFRMVLAAFWVGMLLLIAGCGRGDVRETSWVTPTARQLSATITSYVTETTTASRTPTPVETKIPTATWTMIITPTRTPLPTLSHSQAREIVQELLRTNGGCELPCWWGIIPGKTSWDDAKVFLEQFAMERFRPFASDYEKEKNTVHYWGYFPITDSSRRQDNKGVRIYVRNNIVDMITTGIEVRLPEYMSSFGKPSQIWLHATGIPETGPTFFDIEMLYAANGILAGTSGFGNLRTKDNQDVLRICLEEINADGIGLILWDPAEPWSFDEIGRLTDLLSGPPGGPRYQQKYKLLEDSSNMDVEEFYNTFRDSNANVCLETPMEIWY